MGHKVVMSGLGSVIWRRGQGVHQLTLIWVTAQLGNVLSS